MRKAVRFKVEKDEKVSVYIKGPDKKGFAICIVGPAKILIVKLKKAQKGIIWV
jgi:hypothetical protein